MENMHINSSLLRIFAVSLALVLPLILSMPSLATEGPSVADRVNIGSDCTSDSRYYYFTGYGVGASKAIAAQVALMDARKNALVCVFGGSISYQAISNGTTESFNRSDSTTVAVTADHVDWEAFELVSAQDQDDRVNFTSTAQFRWSRKSINANKERRDNLIKERKRNQNLSAAVTEAQRLAAEKDELLRRQQRELDDMRRHQLDLLGNAAKNDRILSQLERKKREREEKDGQWLRMVLKFGCGVTISDLRDVLGKPQQTLVYTIEEGSAFKNRPLLYYVYGNFALVAPVHDELWLNSSRDTTHIKRNSSRYQITYVERFRGDGATWVICDTSHR